MMHSCRTCWGAVKHVASGVARFSYQTFQLKSSASVSASVQALPSSATASSASASASAASRKLLQDPLVGPVTPQITLDATPVQRAQLESGLSSEYGSPYHTRVMATNNADLATTFSSTDVSVAKTPSNQSLLIAIVVLASIGVSMLLVACLTAFIVRRR